MATFREIGHCIWQAVGSVPTGKHVTVLGGVHGNELTGVHVVEWLKKRCPPLLSGTLTLILGNPKAIELNQRGSAPHADLNRCFTMSVLDSSSTDSSQPYEQARAREIAPFLQQSDLVLDLHATNKPSEPFLKMAGPLTPQHYAVGRWFPCNVLLHDPLYILAGGIALTDEYTGAHGGVGMIFESGIAGDTSRAELVFESVIRILANEMSMVAGPPVHAAPTPPNTVFEITEVFRLPSSGFEWANGHGATNFEHVPANHVIGTFSDAVVQVPYESYIVFPKVPSLWQVGSPLGWLAKRVCVGHPRE
ncbi:hypothetical protein, variant 4 [Aphanomyces invadans]|uniref:Succinylglutamate desuccinylase/Aspartoacylase catalytic domain-containing protein n=1 Tax=Aphanomyces invadans TaxID=157072 RepID=A0A024TCR7_9STRA|nr:hypothetical protein, variant 3 [Aphanomyces invadans]XP_008879446.1 hypothetical protein, variant 4 [Aphanomyces invadans]ETV91808.1 hypothetical protein, variant 3 [Aphanomyces invadans]ETV91809.1 hypothetical protein, variant 4 [Aphanomyces invadans]|eukprot:XP_008879443.1 hypothetical protein, variant 3 [Aphanomyces invadans]